MLMIACANGAGDVVDIFIEHKCNLEDRDAKGKTALLHASENGHYKIVRSLLENNADVHSTTNLNETALHLIAGKGA